MATMRACHSQYGTISLNGIMETQRTNVAIWILYLPPFLFSFWGQYISNTLTCRAGGIIVDETSELKTKTPCIRNSNGL